jgi:predicted glutamine amidotransferase
MRSGVKQADAGPSLRFAISHPFYEKRTAIWVFYHWGKLTVHSPQYTVEDEEPGKHLCLVKKHFRRGLKPSQDVRRLQRL